MIAAPLLDLITDWKQLPHVVVHGDGLAPTIEPHSIVFYDPQLRAVDRDGVYVVRLHPDMEPQPLRLQLWSTGQIGIIHDARLRAVTKMDRRALAPLVLGRAIAHLRLFGRGL